jgi:hypothetical protein
LKNKGLLLKGRHSQLMEILLTEKYLTYMNEKYYTGKEQMVMNLCILPYISSKSAHAQDFGS